MLLRARTMEAADLVRCGSLVASNAVERFRYGPLLGKLCSAWFKLLQAGCLNSTIVENVEGSIPVALGVTVFVTDDLLRKLKTVPKAWIGPTLTRLAIHTWSGILTPEQIRAANSTTGVNLVVWTAVVASAHFDPQVYVELFRGLYDQLVGFQIREVVCQPADKQHFQAAIQAGMLMCSAEGEYIDDHQPADLEVSQPFLMGIDRLSAYRSFGSWFSGLLLARHRPQFYFTPSEQRVLIAALKGLTDDQIAKELGISVAAVKRTWRVIYQRTESAGHHHFPDTMTEKSGGKRGKEKKQHVLTYMRSHMEELRPVLPQSSRRAQA